MHDGDESRKKYVDCARLNPKRIYNGQSAAKLRIGERSTTIAKASKVKRPEMVYAQYMGEDIVSSLMKVKGVYTRLILAT